jgi:hypothetical protein
MSFDLKGIDPLRGVLGPPARPAGAGGVRPAAAGDFAGALGHATRSDRFDAIPASPPPEALDEVLVAQRAISELRARGRELRFEMADGRLRIEMRDLDGNVVKQIPATEALEIASGRLTE